MSKVSRTRERKLKCVGSHQEFLARIKKTLYYGKLPAADCLSLPVTELAAELFSEPQTGRSLERLHCHDAAKISRNACVSPCSLVLALLYLERLKQCNPDYVQRVIPSELFLISLMISSKFLQDDGGDDEVFMDEWATSGGISVKDLVALERDFLHAIDWEVYIKEDQFWQKLCTIEKMLARKEGDQRGWFTYTELESLLSTMSATNLLQALVTIVSVLTVTYTAGILTILSSLFIVSNIPGNCLQHETSYKPQTVHPTLNLTRLDSVDVSEPWDWWSKDALVWLSETSKLVEPIVEHPNYYNADVAVAIERALDLEDQVHKATKLRIQDQMERSWHAEWTDSLPEKVVA